MLYSQPILKEPVPKQFGTDLPLITRFIIKGNQLSRKNTQALQTCKKKQNKAAGQICSHRRERSRGLGLTAIAEPGQLPFVVINILCSKYIANTINNTK